jgi:hypothetical protein
MKKYSLLLLTLFFSFCFQGCKETEPTDPNEKLLANKDWNTDGVYVAVNTASPTKAIAPNVKIRFKNTTATKTITLNGADLSISATWKLENNGALLTVTYPTVTGTSLSFQSQALKVAKLSETELWVTTPEGQSEIKLLGIITITNTMQYRFTTATGGGASLTNATLTTPTWKGNLDATTGIFFNSAKVQDIPAEIKFSNGFTVAGQTFLPGTNVVLVGGIPTSIWGIDNADTPTKLTFAIPTGGSYVTLDVNRLDADELWLTNSGATSFSLFGLITIDANRQLRFAPKP